MNLKQRIDELEAKMQAKKGRPPGMVFLSTYQTFEEAKTQYESKHGYPLQRNAPIVNILTVDCSRDGGGRLIEHKGR